VGQAFNRPTAATVPAGTCTNTCRHANDNECDDGRTNAHSRSCDLGTDCADCGPVGTPFQRSGGGTGGGGGGGGGGAAPAAAGTCTNSCEHANDGECDDGRPGSVTSLCRSGTDCADCGPVS
jgi:hypothetical protein